jgi:DNA-binding beta-propeller fold protein YncE
MRTELEIQQLGPTPARPVKKKRLPLEWLAGALAIALLAWLGYFLFSPGKPKKIIPAGASARSIAISPDGRRLAVGLLDGSLRVLDLQSRRVIAVSKSENPEKFPLAPIQAVAFGPGNSVLVLRAGQSKLYIYSADLQGYSERQLHPNAHDVVWSRALGAALVLTGGSDDQQSKVQIFPARPMGIQTSTAQLLNLITWSSPRYLAVSADGSRLAITYSSRRKHNVLVYNPQARRTASALLVRGEPEGLAFAANGRRLWVTSPQAESVTEIAPFSSSTAHFPRLASTSPPRMIAVSQRTHRVYTTGSLTFPEVDVGHRRILRKVELPERSAGIVLSPDESTAYLTFEKLDIIGVVDLHAMRWVREIQLR